MQTGTLIIGQGIAGSLLAYQLYKRGEPFLVFDPNPQHTASKVAAGMFNPINSKRMVKNDMAEILIPYAVDCYRELEQLLGSRILHLQPVYNVLSSVKEQNDLALKMEQPGFARFVNLDPAPEANLHQPYGAFEVSQAGWVDVVLMLQQFRQWLMRMQVYHEEAFDYAQLRYENGTWLYKDHQAQRVACCEGHQYHLNPYWRFLPCTPTKGDVLTLRCEGLGTDRILKKGLYLVHRGNGEYKAGATYERHFHNNDPSDAAAETLYKKMQDLTPLPFTVLAHEAGVRPTMPDRKPIVGGHPAQRGLYILNGLGAKGTMLAPWHAAVLAEHMLHDAAIDPKFSVARFAK